MSPRRRQLQIRHDDEIVVDARRMLYLVRGKLTHMILEGGDQINALHEYRSYLILPNGLIVTGKIDRTEETNIIDWKDTSVWSFMLGEKYEWDAQCSMYAYLMEQEGFDILTAEINALLRDWMWRRAKYDPDYPQSGFVNKQIALWSKEKTLDYMLERCRLHEEAADIPDDALPLCTDLEMWAKPMSYAVIKSGRSRADKVAPSKDEALKWLERKFCVDRKYLKVVAGKTYRIEERPSERIRCEEFCFAAPFCNQYQEYLLREAS